MPTRETALITTLVATLTTGLWSVQAGIRPRHSRQPLNVVLLIIDDVRWDSLGAAGNRVVRTPRIDQLAKEACASSKRGSPRRSAWSAGRRS